MPWLSRDGIAPTIAGLTFNSLSPYDEVNGVFTPGLAREWYFVDLEGNPITLPCGGIDYDRLEEVYGGNDSSYMIAKFYLYEDATWSDGTPVTVEDVFFTFDLATNHAMSDHAGALVWTNDLLHKYDSGNLIRQGLFTYDRGAAEQGYNIPAEQRDHVIYFHINKVLGGVVPLVSTVLILPQHIFADIISEESPLISRDPTPQQTFAFENPIGSGPFVLDLENTSGQLITLVRRDNYHIRDEDGGHLFTPERIVFVLYQDINVAIYALKRGHIDVLNSSISANFVNLLDAVDDVSVMRNEGLFVQTLVLNINPPTDHMTPLRTLLTDINFRRAIALAICQDELVRMVLNGAGVPQSQGLVSERQPFYNPASRIIEGGTPENLEEANLLLDAIVPDRASDGIRLFDGKRIQFEIIANPGEQTLVSYLQVQLQRIGIEVLFRAAGANPENTFLFPGNFDMTFQGVSLTLANIDIMLEAHFVNLVRSSNYGRFVCPNFASTVTDMRMTINRNYKFELAKEIQLLIANEHYRIPLYSAEVLSAFRTDRFTNFQNVPGARAFSHTSLQNLIFVLEG
jgi:ABC-type transport system substrate-binding protein